MKQENEILKILVNLHTEYLHAAIFNHCKIAFAGSRDVM